MAQNKMSLKFNCLNPFLQIVKYGICCHLIFKMLPMLDKSKECVV